MSVHEMSRIQRMATAGAPLEVAADIEAQSRAWMVQCPKCQAERSIWEMGGIRYRAKGSPRSFMKCFRCGRRSWHRIYWAGGSDMPAAPSGAAGWIVRLVILCVIGGVALAGAIVALVLWLAGAI